VNIDDIDTTTAKLPSRYHAAKAALRDCTAVDECMEWADKASALASYAKQAHDDELERMAKRIRARALRRAGELLKQIEPGQGARDGKRGMGDHTPLYREDAAREAGMSKHQQVTATRIANVPEDDFEEMVESGLTATKIAEAGIERRVLNRDAARHLVGLLRRSTEALAEVDVSEATEALDAVQRAEVRILVSRLDGILDAIVTRA